MTWLLAARKLLSAVPAWAWLLVVLLATVGLWHWYAVSEAYDAGASAERARYERKLADMRAAAIAERVRLQTQIDLSAAAAAESERQRLASTLARVSAAADRYRKAANANPVDPRCVLDPERVRVIADARAAQARPD